MRVFVTGTDTSVGKTEVACALLSLMAERTMRPFCFKPYESGVGAEGPSDSKRLQFAAGGWQPLDTVCLHRYREPLAPGVAARLERRKSSFEMVVKMFRGFGSAPVVVEGAGGLFVPLDEEHDVIDLMKRLELPVVLVARAGLGTLNHVALSLEALKRRKLEVRAVVLSHTHSGADPAAADNPAWLKRRHPGLQVLGPVGHVLEAGRRREAFRSAMWPLL